MIVRSTVIILTVSFLAHTGIQASYPPFSGYRPYDSSYTTAQTVETVVKTTAVVGGIAAVGYGVYKFFNWLFTPSDEKIIQQGVDALNHAHTFYDGTIEFMSSHCNGISDNVYEQQRCIKTVNEPLLYEYAVTYKQDAYIGSVLINMQHAVDSLQSAHAALAGRIKKLCKNNGDPQTMNHMQQLDKEIVAILGRLEFVYEYFNHHQNYFTLFEAEARIMRAYESELQALSQYPINTPYVREVIRSSVMQGATPCHGYPYMRYIDRIQADCGALGSALNSLSYHYAHRFAAAGSLLQNIKSIHALVVVEDAYHQELRDYKKEQLERQRLEAQRAQAAAAQQQACEMQRQNRLHAEQLRLDAERNAIMAAQTIAQVINPPQPAQVNLFF